MHVWVITYSGLCTKVSTAALPRRQSNGKAVVMIRRPPAIHFASNQQVVVISQGNFFYHKNLRPRLWDFYNTYKVIIINDSTFIFSSDAFVAHIYPLRWYFVLITPLISVISCSMGSPALSLHPSWLIPTIEWQWSFHQGTPGGHAAVPLIARFMGPAWAHLGPTGPKWVPCWPHELCSLGRFHRFFC